MPINSQPDTVPSSGNSSDATPLIAIAGASGFVGSSLRHALSDHYRWAALTRSVSIATGASSADATVWRQCDLYSLTEIEEALRGARWAIYLVHSMLPSSRLVQASFADLDLLLADNFIRAAEAAGVEHIIYLGGLIPENGTSLSPHLASRLEVESVLRSRSVPVTVLRAGLIVGPGGSSARMLINLVRRLPVMILPRWASSTTQSIDIRDIIRAFQTVLEQPALRGGTYDLGGHDPMSYRDMIRRTAEALDLHRITLRVPSNAFAFSQAWVALLGGVSTTLVSPLLESLQHDIKAKDNPLLRQIQGNHASFEQSIREAVDEARRPRPNPRIATQGADRQLIRHERRVRSVQRMPLPHGWTALEIAREYLSWMTHFTLGLIRAEEDDRADVTFTWTWPRITLLRFSPTSSKEHRKRRAAYSICGGALARQVDPPGLFEIRCLPENGCLIASIHGYAPRLPWFIYEFTQAFIHLIVMRLFGRHLGRIKEEETEPSESAP